MIANLTDKAKSWKTTTAGTIGAISGIGGWIGIADLVNHIATGIQPALLATPHLAGLSVGLLIVREISGWFVSYFSRDNDKSSADLGIK